ncbi:hypothetical protein AGOR_G00246880 [Albula goreensis]|uniref:Uncharacterized protein n=1 Tax=Albula goreensis TaxID=1534307 RepID=A0A8T3CH35_9TELE|nr:hypothetical protein AGOR_G00246880 [Albula goreensis]
MENRKQAQAPVQIGHQRGRQRSVSASSRLSAVVDAPDRRADLMAKIRVSYEYSEAEDKSIRLGLFLIVCGILSLFILCFCWLSPTLQNMQNKPANCTVISVRRVEEMFECVFTCGTDCKGISLYPCLQVFVNNSESNSIALLHHDEQQLVLNPKCSYVPPCERDNQKNRENVLQLQNYWTEEGSSQSFTCFFNQQRSRDVITTVRRTCVLQGDRLALAVSPDAPVLMWASSQRTASRFGRGAFCQPPLIFGAEARELKAG